MPIDLKYYTAEWRAMRKERLQVAGFCCESCGIRDRSIRESSQGEPYMVYLSIAHRNQYETWKEDAETMVLCQRCHRRFDRQFRRKGGTREMVPIGYALLYVEHRGRKVLAGMSRTLDQLCEMVSVLPSPSVFEVQLVVLLAVVGNGHYVKEADGSFSVVAEYASCTGLASHFL
jgi:hypothetical protein